MTTPRHRRRLGAHRRVAPPARHAKTASRVSSPHGPVVVGVALALAPWAGVFAFLSATPTASAGSTSRVAAVGEAAPDDAGPLPVYPLDPSSTQPPPASWLSAAARLQPASVGLPGRMLRIGSFGALTVSGIPRVALEAYELAAGREAQLSPRCGLPWPVLAGIGYIESDHALSGGSADRAWSGVAQPPILGPVLDGQHGFALIPDTDHGSLDGNARFDRAVGPMQFLPSTWREWGVSAVGTGAPNPQNIFDATLSAARYLCAFGATVRTPQGLIAAIYSYNHSFDYVNAVLTAALSYGGGSLPTAAIGLADLPAMAAAVAADPLAPTVVTSGSPSRVNPQRKKAGSPSIPASPTQPPTPTPTPTPMPTPIPSPTNSSTPSPSPSGGTPSAGNAPPSPSTSPTSSGSSPTSTP